MRQVTNDPTPNVRADIVNFAVIIEVVCVLKRVQCHAIFQNPQDFLTFGELRHVGAKFQGAKRTMKGNEDDDEKDEKNEDDEEEDDEKDGKNEWAMSNERL